MQVFNLTMASHGKSVTFAHNAKYGTGLCFLLYAGVNLASSETVKTPPTGNGQVLNRIVVSATRSERDSRDVPASVESVVVDIGQNARALSGLSDVLQNIPGLTLRNRQNYAQDEQISIRGFGARSTFGVRGVRLYTDDIPATMPDGSGQVSHFSLDAAERIEVLRGPFSALYGNASGGIIALYSARGGGPMQWQGNIRVGSDDMSRIGVTGQGELGALDYHLALSRFSTEGFRDHSAAQRQSGQLRLDWENQFGTHITLLTNNFQQGQALDPLGLTWEQVQQNSRQAVSAAEEFNTRKSVTQDQLGLIIEKAINGSHHLRLLGYHGQREVEQFLAIPIAAQLNPLHSGGVIDLSSRYQGVDLRWTTESSLLSRPITWVAGLAHDAQNQHRQGYENHLEGLLGVRGKPRRNEKNRVTSTDYYLHAEWQLSDQWRLVTGARHSQVRFRSKDHFITASNPNDSGNVHYSSTSPAIGLMFQANENLHFYTSAGLGNETPTFAELAYRSDGNAGLALDLNASRSRNIELGVKGDLSTNTQWDAALFRSNTTDELAVVRNSGGRASYQNVPRSRRQGIEISMQSQLNVNWHARMSYTRLEATFQSPFLTCVETPCLLPSTYIDEGTTIPGIPTSQLYTELKYQSAAWRSSINITRLGRVNTNDLGTSQAPAYALVGMEMQRNFNHITLFARIDNAFDRAYIGSVIVNDGNERFFEPGPSRQWVIGAQWRY